MCFGNYTNWRICWRLSDEFHEEYDDIEWRQLKGLRNIIAHNYEDVIDHIVRDIINDEIPDIKKIFRGNIGYLIQLSENW